MSLAMSNEYRLTTIALQMMPIYILYKGCAISGAIYGKRSLIALC